MGIAHLTHEVPRHVVDVDGALIFPGPRRLPGLGDYRSVRADPLAGCEATWLPHLHAGHGRALRRLASCAAGLLPAGTDVRPVVLDQHGVVLRLQGGGRSRDVRLAFATPVTCSCDVRPAFDELLARARP